MEDFINERNTAFASMNKEKIIAYCKKYNIAVPEKEDLFWAGVHKAICNLYLDPENDITIKQFNKSFDWLVEHGYRPDIEKRSEE